MACQEEIIARYGNTTLGSYFLDERREIIECIECLPKGSTGKQILAVIKKIGAFLEKFKTDESQTKAAKICLKNIANTFSKDADEIECLAMSFKIQNVAGPIFGGFIKIALSDEIEVTLSDQMMKAGLEGNIALLRKIILEHQIDVNSFPFGVHMVIKKDCLKGGSYPVTHFLLQAGLDINQANLYEIAGNGHSAPVAVRIAAIKFLASKGMNVKDLFIAVQLMNLSECECPPAILKCLIELGLDVNASVNMEGEKLLDFALSHALTTHGARRPDFARYLIYAGAETEYLEERIQKSKSHTPKEIQDDLNVIKEAKKIREKVIKENNEVTPIPSKELMAALREVPILGNHGNIVLNIVNEYSAWTTLQWCLETPEHIEWMRNESAVQTAKERRKPAEFRNDNFEYF